MVRTAYIFNNKTFTGRLLEINGKYVFVYTKEYIHSSLPSISLTLPKKQRTHRSPYLFPFFQGLLPEGNSRVFQCQRLRISTNNKFSLLLQLAGSETIGSITVKDRI